MKNILIAPLVVVLTACGAQNTAAYQRPSRPLITAPASAPPTGTQLTQTIDSITSCFENSTKTVQYGYVEALGDGRGYTAGKAGFTTGTGDLLQVVQRYLQETPDAGLEALLPTLQADADSGSGSTEGLEALPALWKNLSRTPRFRAAQDAVTDELYMQPAMGYIEKYKLTSNLAKAIFYDTIIQHGDGGDPDGFRGILKKMGSKPANESAFLMSFLEARRRVLMNPADSSTTDEWRGSVDRVNALERLVVQGHLTLASPFRLTVFGDSYSF